MKKDSRLKIGVLTITALFLLFFGIKFLKGINIFSSEQPYYTHFERVPGLTVSTPIKIKGYKVGVVRKMNFDYNTNNGVEVELSINKKVKIPQDTRIQIKQNPLSGADLVLELGQSSTIIPAKGKIDAENQQTDLMSITQEKILPTIDRLMPQVDSMVRGVNKQVNNPDIAQTVGYIKATAEEIEKLSIVMRQASVKLPEVINNLEKFSQNAIAISEKINRTDVEGLMNNIKQTTDELKSIAQQIESGQGTAGKLISDPSLYNKLDSVASAAEKLIKDLKQNPGRYVQFSLF